MTSSNEKLDILIDHVGQFTEGLTELRAISCEQLAVAQSQAESVKQLVETIRRQAETNAEQTQLLKAVIGKL